MSEYDFYRKKFTSLEMFWIVIKGWFAWPPLGAGCLLVLLLGPLYIFLIVLRLVLFLPSLPVIAGIFLPLSVYLYKRPERRGWVWFWGFAGCSQILCTLPAIVFYNVREVGLFLFIFVILSGLSGAGTFLTLYNKKNVVMVKREKNSV